MVVRMLFFMLVLFAPLTAHAGYAWNLTNTSNSKLNFETLDPARGTWKSQMIYPHQSVKYTMRSAEAKFRISTQNRGYFTYRIYAGGSYNLGWNSTKGIWELTSAAPSYNRRQASRASFELYNASSRQLKFDTLDFSRGTWKGQVINANQTKTYTFSAGTRTGKIRIATTGRGNVEYDTRAGWKYKILWDDNKGVWDVRTVSQGR